jgi:putative Mg2+ transporter-C (MgtC) family protein
MNEFEAVIRVLLALFLGALIGVERVHAKKRAGIRTLGLVAMGSALFVVVSQLVLAEVTHTVEPLRVAAHVITGIGFLGGGMIILRDDKLANLTTAAGIWVAAGIGIAIGFGLYTLGILVTMLVIITFTWMWYLEDVLRKRFDATEGDKS